MDWLYEGRIVDVVDKFWQIKSVDYVLNNYNKN